MLYYTCYMSAHIDTSAALEHFSAVDPHMADLLQSAMTAETPLARPRPKPEREYFAAIVTAIVNQQISVKAAAAVMSRVSACFAHTITAESALTLPEQDLRVAGLSRQKVGYIKRSAEQWPEIPFGNFPHLTDEQVITELTRLPGVGRWTAEMFCMFTLGRPDVFSRGDLGLMNGLFAQYPELRPHHTRKVAATIERWSPHRTVAALTLWYHKDGGPVVL